MYRSTQGDEMKGVRWLTAPLVLSLALVIGGRSASAQTCGISATTVSFGHYDGVTTTDAVTTGNLNYWCASASNARTVTVYLSKGAAPSNNPRKMQPYSGTDKLNYNLYLDAAHTQIWGDPNPFCYKAIVPANTWPNVNIPVYGMIPQGQDVASGTYADNITVTINF
jgi:spore coat protein U-like protein